MPKNLGTAQKVLFSNDPAHGGQAVHQRRGAADCGEYRQAAGAVAEAVASSVGSNHNFSDADRRATR